MNDVSTHHTVELLARYSKISAPLELRPSSHHRKIKTPPPHIHAFRRRLSATTVAQLATDYESGHSTNLLMKRYSLGKGTVLAILAEQGVKMRGQGIPAAR